MPGIADRADVRFELLLSMRKRTSVRLINAKVRASHQPGGGDREA
jgi:hypothetical protein